MAEDKIKHSDIIEDDVFRPTIDEANQLIGVLGELEKSFKAVLSTTQKELTTGIPKTIDDIERFTEAVNKTNDAEKGLIKTQSEMAKLNKQLADSDDEVVRSKLKLQKANQEQKRIIKNQIAFEKEAEGSVNKLRAELGLVTEQWNKLSEAERENTEVGKALSAKKLELTDRLKALEGATGDHRRNVGNYSSALKGLNSVVTSGAKLLGLNTAQIEALDEAMKKVTKVVKGYKQIKESLPGQDAKEIASTEKLTIAQRILNAVRSAGVLGIGLAIVALATLVGAIIAVVNATGDANRLEKERQKAIDGTIIKDDELRSAHNKSIIQLKRLDVEYQKINGSLTEFQATIQNLKLDYLEATTEIVASTRKKIGETNQFWNSFFNIFKSGGSVFGSAKSQIEEIGALQEDFNRQVIDNARETAQKIKNEKAQDDKRLAELEKEKWREIQRINTDAIKDDFQRRRETLKLNAQFDIEDVEASELSENSKYNLVLAIRKKLATDLEKINQEILNNTKNLVKQIEDLRVELIKDDTIREQEKLKKDAQRRIKEINDTIADEKTKAELIALIEKKLQEDLLKITKKNQETQDKLDAEEKKKRLDALKDSENDRRKAIQSRIDMEKEMEDAREENDKNARKKELEETIKTQELITDAVLDGLERRLEKKKQMLDDELKQIDQNISKQQDLANRGLDNTLAFEEKRRAEAIAKKVELEKRARKQEQAQQLANVFLEFLKSFAKEGSATAPAKALAQTLIAKGISDVIAGQFATGVENLDGVGTGTSDSNLALLSKGESVITARGTKENPGLATAINKGMVDEYFSKTYLPSLYGANVVDKSRAEQLDGAIVGLLDHRLRSLEKTIKHKREVDINWNEHGDMVRMEVENGIKRIITQKRRKF